MKFIQDKKTGACDIIFHDEEIKIINKHKKIILTPIALRDFGNTLMAMVASFNLHFDKELANKMTTTTDLVMGKSPDDKDSK